MDDARILKIEIEAAKVLREQIEAISANDPDFIRDTIEGETNIREIVARLVAEEGEEKAVLEGLDRYSDGLAARKSRIKQRIETRRALIATALDIAELKSLDTPTGKVTVTPVAPKAIYQDEALIPSRFWKAGTPTLDKKAVTDALKAGDEIPGATLSNGSKTIRIGRI